MRGAAAASPPGSSEGSQPPLHSRAPAPTLLPLPLPALFQGLTSCHAAQTGFRHCEIAFKRWDEHIRPASGPVVYAYYQRLGNRAAPSWQVQRGSAVLVSWER